MSFTGKSPPTAQEKVNGGKTARGVGEGTAGSSKGGGKTGERMNPWMAAKENGQKGAWY